MANPQYEGLLGLPYRTANRFSILGEINPNKYARDLLGRDLLPPITQSALQNIGVDPKVRDAVMLGAYAAPVTGDIDDFVDIAEGISKKRPAQVGMGLLGAMPLVGDAARMGVESLGLLGGMVKAYHGSPHKFSKFDIKKIGTGEGAQAYGHGLYFAENPKVAGSYTGIGTARGGYDVENKLSEEMMKAQNALDYDRAQVLEELLINRSPQRARARFTTDNGYDEKLYEGLIRQYEGLFDEGGNVYNVKLNVNKSDLLDWDKPLSEQPKKVKEALRKAWPVGYDEMIRLSDAKKAGIKTDTWMNPMAKHIEDTGFFYEELSSAVGGQEKASKILKEAGIPGIKYLDQGSRTAGKGTRNFVIFDDSLVEIAD